MNTQINRYRKKLVPGKRVMIHAYKYNGWLYRCWDFPKIIYENKDFIILDIYQCKILSAEENTKRIFSNPEKTNSFWVFMKREWFNFRIKIHKNKIIIYINIASPYYYEESAIKYYDFDLDFQYSTLGSWVEKDKDEFIENAKKYHYPKQLIEIIKKAEAKVMKLIDRKYFNQFITKNFISKITTIIDHYNKEEYGY